MIICICKNINEEKAKEIVKQPFWGNYINQNCCKCAKELRDLEKKVKKGL